MARTRFVARLAVVAAVGMISGCGLFDRCRDPDRPGLFSRIRGQSPTEIVIPGDCCNGIPPGTATNGGPFLGTPDTRIPGDMILPGPRPAIPPAVEEGQARPMPYDPKTQSRPSVKPAELKTLSQG
jgi:hypothetical protein